MQLLMEQNLAFVLLGSTIFPQQAVEKLLMHRSGKTGALEEIDEISCACYKRFRTEAQAKAFIEDWKESFAEVCRRAIKEGLDQGLRPSDMKLNMERLFNNGGEETTGEEIAKQLDGKLRLGGASS